MVGILTVPFVAQEIQVFPVSAAISDCRSLLESPWYTFCEFTMVKCRPIAVGILMIYVTVSATTSGYLAAVLHFRHEVASALTAGHYMFHT